MGVIGQEHIKQGILNMIQHDRIVHSYIFFGHPGLGTREMALYFARTLQCEARDSRPCGVCLACKKVENGNHPDVHWVDRQKTASIKLKQVQEGLSKVQLMPYEGRYKILIIDESDYLTPEASNALLKALEEPTGLAIFILLTENLANHLPTVVSRCQIMRFLPVSSDVLSKYLQVEYKLQEEVSRVIAGQSKGNIQRALSLINDDEFHRLRNEIVDALLILSKGTQSDIFRLSNSLEENYDEVLDFLENILRDLLIMKTVELNLQNLNDSLLINGDLLDKFKPLTKEYSLDGLIKSIEALWKARQRLDRNANKKLIYELLFYEIQMNRNI